MHGRRYCKLRVFCCLQLSSFSGANSFRKGPKRPQNVFQRVASSPHLRRGELFYLWLELFCLQLSFFAYSPLRPLLDALSHCKQKSPTVSKRAKTVSKKASTVSKDAEIVNCK